MSRLKEQYNNEIAKAMTDKFGYKNPMEVPKLVKIVVNMGVGEAKENQKLLDSAVADMEAITGMNRKYISKLLLPYEASERIIAVRKSRVGNIYAFNQSV